MSPVEILSGVGRYFDLDNSQFYINRVESEDSFLRKLISKLANFSINMHLYEITYFLYAFSKMILPKLSKPSIVSTNYGFNILLNFQYNNINDKQLYYIGCCRHDYFSILKKLVKKHDVVIDIGSGSGLTSLSFAKLLDQTGYVYAFEPYPLLFESVQKSIFINAFRNIKIFNNVISDYNGKTKVFFDKKSCRGKVLSRTQRFCPINYIEANVKKLDDFLNSKNIGKVDLINICSNEGLLEIFNGACNLLSGEESPIVVIQNFKSHSFMFYDFINGINGYSVYRLIYDNDMNKLVIVNSRFSVNNGDVLICLKDKHIKQLSNVLLFHQQ